MLIVVNRCDNHAVRAFCRSCKLSNVRASCASHASERACCPPVIARAFEEIPVYLSQVYIHVIVVAQPAYQLGERSTDVLPGAVHGYWWPLIDSETPSDRI